MSVQESELSAWKFKDVEAIAPQSTQQTGISVDVVNISYCVTVNGKVKQLLRDVNLSLQTGEMCALMGPSGAGKRY